MNETFFNKKDRFYMVGLFLLVLLLTGVPSLMLHTGIAIDEAGTASNAALLAGSNWGNTMIYGGGFYYKYGQALLWILPVWLFDDPIMMYRGIMIVDSACMALTAVLAYAISRKHMGIESENTAAVMSALATTMPAVLLNSLYARADVMLIVASWIASWFFLEAYDAKTPKKRFWNSIFLAAIAVYAYMCHTRGIVLLIAICMTIAVIWWFQNRRKVVHVRAFAVTTVVLMVLDRILTRYFKNHIWGENGTQRSTIENFNFGALLDLFTLDGISSWIKACTGWLFNAFTTTGGMVCIGLIACVIIIVLWIRKEGKVPEKVGVLATLNLLNFMGSFALGMLYFFHVVHSYFMGTYDVRGDRIIYDRYILGGYGILCLIAFYVLFIRNDLFKIRAKLVSIVFYGGVLGFFCWKIARYLDNHSVTLRYFASMNIFTEFEPGEIALTSPNTSTALIKLGILMFLVFLVMMIISMGKRVMALSLVLALSSASLYTISCKRIRIDEDARQYEDLKQIYEYVSPLNELADEYPDVFIKRGCGKLKKYQFLLNKFTLSTREVVKQDDLENAIVIVNNLSEKTVLSEGASYYLFDGMEYGESVGKEAIVKGDELAKKIEEMGIALIPYENN